MGTEKTIVTGSGRGGLVKSPGSLALMTSPDRTGHSHSARIFVLDARDGNVVGETSLSTGDQSEGFHGHPFTLNMETGELRIGEANDHDHSVDPDELASMVASLRDQIESGLIDEDPLAIVRSDDKGPGARIARQQMANGEIGFVSLCRRGMNGIETVMKSDGRFKFTSSLTKMDEKEGLLHTLVWVPDLPCHEGDIMTAEEVRKMAHGFLPNGGHIDIEHNGKPQSSDKVSIAEHYIVPPGDPKFRGIRTSEGVEIDPAGSWGLILKILDPELRAAYDTGEWNGVSMAGRAEFTPIDKSVTPQTPNDPEDFLMTPEERKEFAKELTDGIASVLVDALKPNVSPAEPVEPAAVAPVIDPPADLTDNADLQKYLDDLFIASLDLTKSADITKLMAHNAKKAKAEVDAKAKVEADAKAAEEAAELAKQKNDEGTEDETELAKAVRERDEANARVEKLEKSSRQSTDPETPVTGPQMQGVSKEEKDQAALGLAIAKKMKTRRMAS